MGEATELKKANGEVLRIIDGAYVVGAGGACEVVDSPCGSITKRVLGGAYLLEEDCRGEIFNASKYRILLQRSDLPAGITMPDFDFLIDFTSNSGSIITFFYGHSSEEYSQSEASGFCIRYYNNILTFQFSYYDGTEHIDNSININDGAVSVKQRNNSLIIKNNGTEIFNKNVKLSFEDFDNGDLILGGSDYEDGPEHIYDDFGDFILKKLECSLIEEYGH